MELQLLNGRPRLNEPADEWVFRGPVLRDVQSVQQKYRDTTTVQFHTSEAAALAKTLTGWGVWDTDVLEVRWCEDLIETRGLDGSSRYYGDMVLIHRSVIEEIDKIVDDVNKAGDALKRELRRSDSMR
jgi:hypothetical protein